ncbi:NAD(P)H-binding protein [Flavihumibacter stibioxidans]|uniref:NAD(P)-binding domain-containing protein n=1 Tax=Flavihumibacter stibioxidans TaxID=1834163 RepID=A0ABR7M3Y6_9BACT|nr:NAD(P)H-binding protein [Flavihumibacter stibioxidans]MBC6489338.1 hypothetical protein [Flavihumibacter stibioxidans]
MGRKATLLGASGLIGSHLLDLLLADPYYDEVTILVRRNMGRTHPKLTEIIIDFENSQAYEPGIAGAETVFCAIGTTMKKVSGDHDAYRQVDFNIPVTAAKAAAGLGVFNFVLVSSVGADAANNNNFYLKLKGVVEETISKENIPQIHIFRPSLLIGHRNEKRTGEGFAQMMAPIFSGLMVGKWRVYKPIRAALVAKAMLSAAKLQNRGIFIHTYDDILKFTKDQYPE